MRESMFAIAAKKLNSIPHLNLDSMKNAKGRLQIRLIPKLHEAASGKRKNVIKILRLCPFSDFYGEDKNTLKQKLFTKGSAQRELCAMVMRWNKSQALSSISEKNSAEEESNHNGNVDSRLILRALQVNSHSYQMLKKLESGLKKGRISSFQDSN